MAFADRVKGKKTEPKKEIENMKTVKFELGDCPQPKRVGPAKSFALCSPIAFTLPANGDMSLKLGIKCSHPMLVYSSSSCGGGQCFSRLQGGSNIVDAGQDVLLTITNGGTVDALIERGDSVVRAHVLDDSDIVEQK